MKNSQNIKTTSSLALSCTCKAPINTKIDLISDDNSDEADVDELFEEFEFDIEDVQDDEVCEDVEVDDECEVADADE